MKLVSVLVAALAGTTVAYGQEESPHVATGSVALATDYLFRGISQTDNGPAVQGSLEYNYTPWGTYLGAWASNVDNATSEGEIEIDWYGGFRGEFATTGVGWDVGAIYYHYPGDNERPAQRLEADYVEAKAGLSYTLEGVSFEPVTSATVYWSPDYYRETDDAVYVDGSLGLSLPYGLGLGFHVGYQYVDALDQVGDGDYIDWKVGLSREVLGFGLDVSYWNAEDVALFCGIGSEQCGGTVLGTISKKF